MLRHIFHYSNLTNAYVTSDIFIMCRIITGRILDDGKNYEPIRRALFQYISLLEEEDRLVLYNILFDSIQHFVTGNK